MNCHKPLSRYAFTFKCLCPYSVVLQIHDELLFEVEEGPAAAAAVRCIRAAMEVGPGKQVLPCHPPRFRPSFLELNGIFWRRRCAASAPPWRQGLTLVPTSQLNLSRFVT